MWGYTSYTKLQCVLFQVFFFFFFFFCAFQWNSITYITTTVWISIIPGCLSDLTPVPSLLKHCIWSNSTNFSCWILHDLNLAIHRTLPLFLGQCIWQSKCYMQLHLKKKLPGITFGGNSSAVLSTSYLFS